MSHYAPDSVSEQAAIAGACIYPRSIESITTAVHAAQHQRRIEDMFEGAGCMAAEGDDKTWLRYLDETCNAIYMDHLARRGGQNILETYWQRRISGERSQATPQEVTP